MSNAVDIHSYFSEAGAPYKQNINSISECTSTCRRYTKKSMHILHTMQLLMRSPLLNHSGSSKKDITAFQSFPDKAHSISLLQKNGTILQLQEMGKSIAPYSRSDTWLLQIMLTSVLNNHFDAEILKLTNQTTHLQKIGPMHSTLKIKL